MNQIEVTLFSRAVLVVGLTSGYWVVQVQAVDLAAAEAELFGETTAKPE